MKESSNTRPSSVVTPAADKTCDARCVDDAVDRLLGVGMRAHRNELLAVLDFCREARTMEEVEGLVNRLTGENATVFDACAYCRQLNEAGALDRIDPPEPELVEEEVDGKACLRPGPGRPVRWVTSAGGLRALSRHDLHGQVATLIADEPAYEGIYLRLLCLCDAEGGATAAAMGAEVDDDPAVQEPRLYAPHFFNRLSKCGAIAWHDRAWHTTEVGRDYLEHFA